MKTIRHTAHAVLFAASALVLHTAHAQLPSGFSRTDVLRHDLGTPGKEAIQVLVGFEPGTVSPNHSHPGEEIAFVLEGTLEYELEGQPKVTLKAGQALFIPAGVNHLARNVGSTKAVELATYLVTKGKPLLVIAK